MANGTTNSPRCCPSNWRSGPKTALKQLFDGSAVFDTPKPVELVEMILRLGSRDGIVLDFFAGSGTTGHAVMKQNAADAGSRRFVLVQLPEPLDAANKDQLIAAEFCRRIRIAPTIAELTKERLRRAKAAVQGESARLSDSGFRVFKLDSSNIRAWESDPANLDKTLLDSIEHIKPDRSESDLLYELLLKLGLDLCVPIVKKRIAGKAVHSIGGGVLMVCLAEKITPKEVDDLARGIVAWHEELSPAGDVTCVFRDSAFTNDVAKTNLAAILHQHGLEIVRSL